MIKEIDNLVKHLDVNKVLTDETRKNITVSLDRFLINAISKFIRGQEEHGGDIRDRNLDFEIRDEITDLFFYNEAKLWKQQK